MSGCFWRVQGCECEGYEGEEDSAVLRDGREERLMYEEMID